MTSLKIAYVVNNAAFFVSHRLPLAIAAKQTGHRVTLFTGQAGSDLMERAALKQLDTADISHSRTLFRGSGLNPLTELIGLIQLMWFMLIFKPDIVHCASPKGVLYGGIAARLCRVRGLVLAITGMGYAYTEDKQQTFKRKVVKKIYGAMAMLAFNHRNAHVIVQNGDDYSAVQLAGLVKNTNLSLIPGSGVDLSLYNKCDASNKEKLILLPARMLKDKGVFEFVEAARKIKKLEPKWRFVLAGAAGYDNPSSISEKDLQAWQDEGAIEWLGHLDDMVPLFQSAAIVCLPSYREGMPKALLEAAAASCAVVTTDVTGCREAVKAGVTGDLVPAQNIELLASAILSLIRDDSRRHQYGVNGKMRASEYFSIQSVIKQTMNIYEKVSHYD